MAVNGPVGQDDVRFLAVNQLSHFLIALQIDFCVAIDLVHENVACSGDLAGSLGLLNPYCSGLGVGFAGDAGLAAGKVNTYDFVTCGGKKAHCAAGAGFGVVGMSANNQYLALFKLFAGLVLGK